MSHLFHSDIVLLNFTIVCVWFFDFVTYNNSYCAHRFFFFFCSRLPLIVDFVWGIRISIICRIVFSLAAKLNCICIVNYFPVGRSSTTYYTIERKSNCDSRVITLFFCFAFLCGFGLCRCAIWITVNLFHLINRVSRPSFSRASPVPRGSAWYKISLRSSVSCLGVSRPLEWVLLLLLLQCCFGSIFLHSVWLSLFCCFCWVCWFLYNYNTTL